jgi:hypothetical protein
MLNSSTISLTQLAWYFCALTSVCSKEDKFIEAVSNKNLFKVQTTTQSSTISLKLLAWYFWARTSVCSKEDTFIGAVGNKNPFTPRHTAQPSLSRSWPGTSGPASLSAARRIIV